MGCVVVGIEMFAGYTDVVGVLVYAGSGGGRRRRNVHRAVCRRRNWYPHTSTYTHAYTRMSLLHARRCSTLRKHVHTCRRSNRPVYSSSIIPASCASFSFHQPAATCDATSHKPSSSSTVSTAFIVSFIFVFNFLLFRFVCARCGVAGDGAGDGAGMEEDGAGGEEGETIMSEEILGVSGAGDVIDEEVDGGEELGDDVILEEQTGQDTQDGVLDEQI